MHTRQKRHGQNTWYKLQNTVIRIDTIHDTLDVRQSTKYNIRNTSLRAHENTTYKYQNTLDKREDTKYNVQHKIYKHKTQYTMNTIYKHNMQNTRYKQSHLRITI